ncbi:unnamed protein product, partial [Amoebophrya sp. A25]
STSNTRAWRYIKGSIWSSTFARTRSHPPKPIGYRRSSYVNDEASTTRGDTNHAVGYKWLFFC